MNNVNDPIQQQTPFIQNPPAQISSENQPISEPSNKKRISFPLVIGIVMIMILVAGGAYLLLGTKNSPLQQKSSLTPTAPIDNSSSNRETVVNEAVLKDDTIKKDTVNHINSLMKQYYVQKNSYPKMLIDLRSVFNIDDEDLKLYVNPPFYFTSNGTTYEYYAKLNNGEIFKSDTEGTNKNLDASVQVDVNNITSAVNIFYSDTKRLPKNLGELSTLSDLSFFKMKNNPITNKPYTYIPKSDNTGFIVSGTLSDGSEYKQDIPTR